MNQSTEKNFIQTLQEMENSFRGYPGIMGILNMPKVANDLLSNPIPQWSIEDIYAIGLHGWTAHSMFDDIRDEKITDAGSGAPASLSIANAHANQIFLLKARLHLSDVQESYIANVMQKMEHANFMEECDINDRGYIFRSTWKSMGASIPLLLLIMKSGTDKKYLRFCLSYFYHLIAARQLSDDAVDWKEDLAYDRSTLVTHLLTEAVHKGRSRGDLSDLQAIFDEEIRPVIARRIVHHSTMAISFAKKLNCFRNTDFLESPVRLYQTLGLRILQRHRQREQFDLAFWTR